MAGDFGVEGRGRFYGSVGALREVVQNHLLQVPALVAMEPPAGASASDTQDKKAEVFRAMPPADPRHCVRGQYQGYADVPGVASGSATETFVALRLEIDNWRWADVPVFLRAGKALPHKVTEVRLAPAPHAPAGLPPQPARAEPNQIVLRIDPDPGPAAAAVRPGRTVLPHGPLGHLFRPRARRAARAIRGAAACRDGRRPPVLRPGGQRPGDLADRAAAARPPARRPPLPARVLGTRGGGNPAPRPPALPAAVAARAGPSP